MIYPVRLQGTGYADAVARLEQEQLIGEVATVMVHPEHYGIVDIQVLRRSIFARIGVQASCGPMSYAALRPLLSALEELEKVLDTKHQVIEEHLVYE